MLPDFFYYSIANSQPNNLVDLFGRGVFGEKPTQGMGRMMRDAKLAAYCELLAILFWVGSIRRPPSLLRARGSLVRATRIRAMAINQPRQRLSRRGT